MVLAPSVQPALRFYICIYSRTGRRCDGLHQRGEVCVCVCLMRECVTTGGRPTQVPPKAEGTAAAAAAAAAAAVAVAVAAVAWASCLRQPPARHDLSLRLTLPRVQQSEERRWSRPTRTNTQPAR